MASDPPWATTLGPAPWHAHPSSGPAREAGQHSLGTLMAVPLLTFPDGDTLVYIDPVPEEPVSPPQLYPNIPLRVHSEKLLATYSASFDRLFHPQTQSRVRQQREWVSELPRGIRYVIDLTPSTQGEDALATIKVFCPLGIRAWSLWTPSGPLKESLFLRKAKIQAFRCLKRKTSCSGFLVKVSGLPHEPRTRLSSLSPSQAHDFIADLGGGLLAFRAHSDARIEHIRHDQLTQTIRAFNNLTEITTEGRFDIESFYDQVRSYVRSYAKKLIHPYEKHKIALEATETLTCLGNNQYCYLPLWACGDDDGTGTVFANLGIPTWYTDETDV